jgi:membrane protease YdiL (CAAX protease family)
MDPQQINHKAEPPASGRLLLWIVGLFAASLLIGALLAAPVFNVVLWLGRNFQSLESLRDVEFERVASRCVLIVLLLSFVPVLKRAGMRGWSDIGFPAYGSWWKPTGLGLLIGSAATALLFLGGWALGAYGIRDIAEHGAIGKSLVYFFGALLVGFIEEGLFRGALFGALRRSIGFWGGAVIASVVFSAVHFAKPRPPISAVYGHWYSGFDLIPHMFNTVDLGPQSFPLALTLFFLGVVLCAFYQRFGSLYFSIGLHAGLVWLMRIGGYFLERIEARMPWLFGDGDVVSKSYSALFVVGAFMVVSLWMCRGRFGRRGG